MIDINEVRVRTGEYNEALCLSCELHPRSELAAQKTAFRKATGETVEFWSVFFVSSRTAYTISSGLSEEAAARMVRKLAPHILWSKNPAQAARRWNR